MPPSQLNEKWKIKVHDFDVLTVDTNIAINSEPSDFRLQINFEYVILNLKSLILSSDSSFYHESVGSRVSRDSDIVFDP